VKANHSSPGYGRRPESQSFNVELSDFDFTGKNFVEVFLDLLKTKLFNRERVFGPEAEREVLLFSIADNSHYGVTGADALIVG